ncbi:hypothetical protein EW026_g710 [Hermanssonia centrifuga]|uniref:General stress protein FMN-binding split barrel domain-containing protein n=1 Tax=Hermanssonia centrifuga TaxID=98765 RepID=A0A4S4KVK0_9APHY|nr:hypothetical protein EW026_g710 [Hermanssonia centrifuga]
MSSYNKELDPYSTKAKEANANLTPQQKIDGLHAIVKKVKTAMLTTRDTDGHMHSRAMAPAGPYVATQVNLVFIANKASHKFEEIQNDAHVNVSFYDEQNTNWASYCGIAKVSQDKDLIAKHWSSMTSAWFGDLKDGVHKGDQHDPRVTVIEILVDEVRYWLSTESTVAKMVDISTAALTGRASAPGELRTIGKEEVQLLQGIQSK